MTLIPALGRQRQVDLYEFMASLVYKSKSQDRQQSYGETLSRKTKQTQTKDNNHQLYSRQVFSVSLCLSASVCVWLCLAVSVSDCFCFFLSGSPPGPTSPCPSVSMLWFAHLSFCCMAQSHSRSVFEVLHLFLTKNIWMTSTHCC